jgi:hypothetical protein
VPSLSAQPIRRQIVVATCALLLLLAAAIVWSGIRTRAERRDEVRQEAASVAKLAAAYLNQYFEGLDAIASSLVRDPAVISFDEAQCRRIFATILSQQPLLLNAVLRDRNGTLRVSGADAAQGRPEGPVPPNVLQVLRTGRAGVTGLSAGPVTGKPTIGEAYPVRGPDQAIVGVLALGLDLLELQRTFENLDLP